MSTGIDDAAVTGRLARMERELRAIEEAIQPPAPFTFTLAGEASTITLRFRNTSTTRTAHRRPGERAEPARVPQPDTEVLLTPEAITDVTIPIEARSNGTSEVTVEVLTPSGSVIGEPIVLTARVNALSGLGQLLTGAALVGARDVVVQPLPPQAASATQQRRHATTTRARARRSKGTRRPVEPESRPIEPVDRSTPAVDPTVRPSTNGDAAAPDAGRGVVVARTDRRDRLPAP